MIRSAKATTINPGKNVRAKAGLNRSISSQAWALFRQRLTDKATNATSPSVLVAVNPACTSLRCFRCGHTDKRNRKSQAIFCCLKCGYTDNADVNAAHNIVGRRLAVTGRGGTSHARSTKTEHSDPMKRQPPGLVAA